MARQGRCNAAQVRVMATTLLLMLTCQFMAIQAAEFTVGDAAGWSFNVDSWAKDKKFKDGDVLIFKYDPSRHNVAQVDINGFNSCSASSNSNITASGNDRVPLKKGEHHFICTFPGHCAAFGMKLKIIAE